MNDHIALFVIDVQEALIEKQPAHEYLFLQNVRKLIETAREYHKEVIYVRHDGGMHDILEKEHDGWQICKEIAPLQNEIIIDKCFNSAFKDTFLQSYLEEKHIKELMIVGMQSEHCIDATIKSAFEKGYKISVPHGATTTFDNEAFYAEQLITFYEQQIWNNRYANVCTMEKAIALLAL